jgi:hypothetical protein
MCMRNGGPHVRARRDSTTPSSRLAQLRRVGRRKSVSGSVSKCAFSLDESTNPMREREKAMRCSGVDCWSLIHRPESRGLCERAGSEMGQTTSNTHHQEGRATLRRASDPGEAGVRVANPNWRAEHGIHKSEVLRQRRSSWARPGFSARRDRLGCAAAGILIEVMDGGENCGDDPKNQPKIVRSSSNSTP